MNDLFKKLNLLVKSSMNDVLGDNRSQRQPDPVKLGKQLGNEVRHLRTRVNDAVSHEETLQDRVAQLHQQIANLDQEADEAVKMGKEAQARHLITQMQRLQQRTEMAEADLREHQLVTQELIQRVNLLDAIVSESQHNETTNDEAGEVLEDSANVNQSIQDTMNTLSGMLRNAREKISSVTSSPESTDDSGSRLKTNADPDDLSTVDDSTVNDDFEARLTRLTKPKKP